MSRKSTTLFKAALSALHYSGAGRAMAPFTRGVGAILMLHQVRPEPPEAFEPNRILKVTPEFLEAVVSEVVDAGFDVVSLDEVARRLTSAEAVRPFVSFTFDDGYRDNRDYAYPIFKRRGLPFAIYVPSAFADGHGDLWWLTLEDVVRKSASLTVEIGGSTETFATDTLAGKEHAFHRVYWQLRAMPEREARAIVHTLAREIGADPMRHCERLVMTWDEIRELARDPLVTIGAHTCHHFALAKLSAEEARAEMSESIRRVETELGRACRHFSYPYGDETSAGEREFAIASSLGLATAVTTRKGLIRRSHGDALTALPRMSLNGDFQDVRYVKVMLTGAPFALYDVMRRVPRLRAAAA